MPSVLQILSFHWLAARGDDRHVFPRDIQTIFARLERKNYLIFALALRIEVLSHRANQFTSVLKYWYIMENDY